MNIGPPNRKAPLSTFTNKRESVSPILPSSSSEEELKDLSSSSDQIKQDSPINQPILTDLKSVNIDRTRYHHYGHQSLLTLKSLEKIIIEGKRLEKEESERNLNEQASSSLLLLSTPSGVAPVSASSTSSSKSLLEKAPIEKAPVEKAPMEKPSLPQDKSRPFVTKKSSLLTKAKELQLDHILQLDIDLLKDYNENTLIELFRYKTEQEVTKQEQLRNDFAHCTLELLKLADSLNVSPDLIPLLFVSNIKAEELKQKFRELSTSTSINIKRQAELELGSTLKRPASSSSPDKRTLASPVRSPNRLPTLPVHSRNSSGNTIEKDTSPQLSNAKPVLLPLPVTAGNPNVSSQYPVYFNSSPPGADTKYLGSPYNQKQQYNTLQQIPSNASTNAPPLMGYGQKFMFPNKSSTSPYQYYLSSTPPDLGMPLQHQLQPNQQQQIQQQQHHHHQNQLQRQQSPRLQPPNQVRSNILQNVLEDKTSKTPGGGNILRFDKHGTDEQSHSKKLKSSSRSSNINFMITTPENPPAKKYNKNH